MTFRELRKRRGLTQRAIANAVGTDPTLISQIELGKVREPRYSIIIGIAKVLNTTPEKVIRAIESGRTLAA